MSEGQSSDQPKNISRREFLKHMGILLAGAAATKILIPNTTLNTELEPKPVSQTIIIDTTNKQSLPNIPGVPTLESLEQAIPPSTPLQTPEDRQFYLLSNQKNLQQKFGDSFYTTELAIIIEDQKKNHGPIMFDEYNKSASFFGNTNKPILYPSEEIYHHTQPQQFIEKGKDWENHGLEITITAESTIPVLEKAKRLSKSEHTVFNISWQLGNQAVIAGEPGSENPRFQTRWSKTKDTNGKDLFYVYPDQEYGPLDGQETIINGKNYVVFDNVVEEQITQSGNKDKYTIIDGKYSLEAKERLEAEKLYDQLEERSKKDLIDSDKDPIVNIETREAYRSETVKTSITEVVNLANTFPNDFLVFSAGNIRDDLRNINPLPNNAIIVGEWQEGSIKPTGEVYGAEIYVPNSELKLKRGSSSSAIFISATANQMITQGVPLNEIKIRLQQTFSRHDQYEAASGPNTTIEKANILDTEKVKNIQIF